MFHTNAPRLGQLVGDVDVFRRHVVFRRPLLTAVADRDDVPMVEVDRLWSDLLGRGARQPAFRMVRDGSSLPGADVTRAARIGNRDLDDVIDPNTVIDRYRAGATVVLQGLHHTDPVLGCAANNLALDLDHPIQVNAYLSPANTTGLDLHFDYHDVFIVQIGGSKRWRVWEPLPRTVEPVKGKHRMACRGWMSSVQPRSTSPCASATACTCRVDSPTRHRASTPSRTT